MSKQREPETLLGPLRVLDLTDDKGFYCGKVLGDLGADVIKVEPPGGDPARNIGPFYKDIPDPEKSLYWWAYNTSKKGITLNIETVDGQEIFKRLVKSAEVLLESFAPGYMDKLGLGYPALSEINPGLVMTSITPFGQTGPYRDWKGPDIVGICLGGQAYVMGDLERSPCRISFPQAYLHASVHAAGGTLAALRYRELSGEGQYVDVSMQDAMLWSAQGVVQNWELMRENLVRGGVRGKFGPFISRFGFPCKDGDVAFLIGGGILAAISMPAMVKWLAEEGMLGAFEPQKDWGYDEWLYRDVFAVTQEEVDAHEYTLRCFFATKTRAELYEQALNRHIILCPSSTAKDLAENVQLKARGFYVEVEHPELDETITYAGAPYKMTEASCSIFRRAPLIGENNEEIYEQELGFSKEGMRILKEAGVI